MLTSIDEEPHVDFPPTSPAQPASLSPGSLSRPRLPLVDVARGLAIVAMVIYHFSWDLSFFGLIGTDIATAPGWRLFAQMIAGSFLGLVGIGLVLAHGDGIRWRPFLRRLGLLIMAAAAVTLGSYFLFPDSFIFFGILHAIALTSVLGLAFVRLPWFVTAAAAAIAFALPGIASSSFFNAPGWLWLGLATRVPTTNDYIPLLPWFGCVLAGIAIARLLLRRATLPAWSGQNVPGPIGRGLVLAGRHSLAIYLTHQLVLLGMLWAFVQVVQPARITPFQRSCAKACIDNGSDAATCARYCSCASDALARLDMWDKMSSNSLLPQERQQLSGAFRQCRAGAERPTP
nr:heparan-alpha-glucosaminide N-acetyltransferase [Chelatococcus sp. HY11]